MLVKKLIFVVIFFLKSSLLNSFLLPFSIIYISFLLLILVNPTNIPIIFIAKFLWMCISFHFNYICLYLIINLLIFVWHFYRKIYSDFLLPIFFPETVSTEKTRTFFGGSDISHFKKKSCNN